jgi:hypothetical protein
MNDNIERKWTEFASKLNEDKTDGDWHDMLNSADKVMSYAIAAAIQEFKDGYGEEFLDFVPISNITKHAMNEISDSINKYEVERLIKRQLKVG